MARETTASSIQSGHITAQVGICAFNGVSLFFTGFHIVKSPSFTLAVDQFFVADESIAEELGDLLDQGKGGIDQRLQRLVSALFDHIKG